MPFSSTGTLAPIGITPTICFWIGLPSISRLTSSAMTPEPWLWPISTTPRPLFSLARYQSQAALTSL